MILYIIAIPFFSFILPIVSFWQMDDFSWCVSSWSGRAPS
jgi:chitin synthase